MLSLLIDVCGTVPQCDRTQRDRPSVSHCSDISYSLSLLLSQYLSCQASKFVGVYFLQRHDFWFKIEQELHIGGECQEVTVTAYVVVAKLNEMLHAVFLGMFPNGGDAFGLCCFGFPTGTHSPL